MNQYEGESRRPIYPPPIGGVQENPNNHPNPSRRQNFVRVNPRHDQQAQIQRKSCKEGCKWSCTTLLTLCVAFVHILVSTSIASVSNDMTTILFAVAAITINVFLCYGAIFSRKETLITWLAFYGILLFVAMSCITPKHLKVRNNLLCILSKFSYHNILKLFLELRIKQTTFLKFCRQNRTLLMSKILLLMINTKLLKHLE